MTRKDVRRPRSRIGWTLVSILVAVFLLAPSGLSRGGQATGADWPASAQRHAPSPDHEPGSGVWSSIARSLPSPWGISTSELPSRVAYTVEPTNGTLLQGRHSSFPASHPDGAIFDPISRQLLVGDSVGNDVYALNATTAAEIHPILDSPTSSGSDPVAFALDPVHDVLWVANMGAGITAINLTTDSFIKRIPLADGPRGIAYDPSNGFVYAVGFSTGLVTVVNTTTGTQVSNGTVHGASSITFDPWSNTLYLTDSGSGTIFVVDPATLRILDRIVPGTHQFGPWAAVFDPELGAMIVAGGANISIINATTNRLEASNSSVFVGGSSSSSLALNPSTHEVYVGPAGRVDGLGVAVIDSRTGVYVREIVTAASDPATLAYAASSSRLFAFAGTQPMVTIVNGTTDAVTNLFVPLVIHYYGAAFDPGNGLTYVATNDAGDGCTAPGSLTLVRPAPRTALIGSIQVGYGPQQVAVDVARHRVFVTDLCSNAVTVVNDSTNVVVNSSVPVGMGPEGIAVDGASGTVYVSDVLDDTIWTINETTLVSARLLNFSNYTQPSALAYDPFDHRMFVGEYGTGNLSVIDTLSRTLLSSVIHVGSNTRGLLFDPANRALYVACSGSANVSVVNASTLAVAGAIPTDAGPVALALDQAARVLFVSAFSAGTVNLIDANNNSRVPGFVRVLTGPFGITYNPASNQVDVFDTNNGTVSVLASAPQIASLSALPNLTEPGVPTVVVTQVVNGSAPYDYSNSSLPVGCGPLASAEVNCTFPQAGVYSIYLNLTDASGYPAWGVLRETVGFPPRVTALRASVSALDVGGTVVLTTIESGGLPPLAYQYYGLPPGCRGANVSVLSCRPSGTGLFAVTATVTDALGLVVTATMNLTVNPRPAILEFGAEPQQPFVNQSLTLSVVATGGTGPLTYSFTGLPAGCAGGAGAVISCRPSLPGNTSVMVSVSDSTGATADSTASVAVQPLPSLSLGFAVVPSAIPLGAGVTFFANATGSVGAVVYSYDGLPPGCAAGHAGIAPCTPTAPGNYTVTVTVADSVLRHISKSTVLRVGLSAESPRLASTLGFTASEVSAAAALGAAMGAAVVYWARGRGKGPLPADRGNEPTNRSS